MKRNLLAGVLLMTLTVLSAQEIPNLILSEIYMGYGNPWRTYAEITNIGTTTADMSKVFIHGKTNTNYSTSGDKAYLIGTGLDGRTTSQVYEDTITILEPGKSIMVLVNKWSAIADPSTLTGPQRLKLYEPTNTYHRSRTPYFYLQNYGIPSIVFEMDNPWLGTNSNTPMRLWNGDDGLRLLYDRGPGGTPADGIFDAAVDSIIDMIGPDGIRMHYSFAGVTNSSDDHVIIRKSSVTTGNPDNETFLESIGDSPELSEWMVIPIRSHPGTAGRFFTTMGIHGDTYPMDISSTDPAVTVNESTIDMPWGVRRDSIQHFLDFGPNMGWFLEWGPDTLESVVCQTGDTLEAYLCNEELTKKQFILNVNTVPADLAEIFPKLRQDEGGNWYVPYNMTDDIERETGNMDTIYLPFEHRIDTLVLYTEVATGASWEISLFVDGTERSFLRNGDILTVTAPDGTTTKDYYIDVAEFVPSENAFLEIILLNNDTLYNFVSTTLNYSVNLAEGVNNFPVITARPESGAAEVEIQRATHLRGGVEERTAIITVTAESDTTFTEYRLTFVPALLTEQEFFADPIVSEHYNMDYAPQWNMWIELFNPGSVPLSLGDYVLSAVGSASQNLTDVLTDTARSHKLRPGYRLDPVTHRYVELTDLEQLTTDIDAKGAWVGTRYASDYTPELDTSDVNYIPPGPTEVWDMKGFASGREAWNLVYDFRDGNWVFNDLGHATTVPLSIAISRIDDDGIWDGSASAIDNSQGDIMEKYCLIDVWGSVTGVPNNHIYGGFDWIAYEAGYDAVRIPEIVFGNTESFGSFGTNEEDMEWDMFDNGSRTDLLDRQSPGSHASILYVDFISIISSIPYIVAITSDDFTTGTIEKVVPTTSVDDFLGNIIKADPDQLLVVKSGGVVITSGDISEGDVLEVTSKDGKTNTTYTISLGELSSVATLSSSVYTVESGAISGIPVFTTLADVLSNITKDDEKATLSIVDADDQLVGIQAASVDTAAGVELIDVIATKAMWFEVVAEDGVTKEMYQLVVDTAALPYITSDWYHVDQERLVINNFMDGKSFDQVMAHLWPSEGASVKVYDKTGFERTSGVLYMDDYVVVTDDADGLKTQTYTFTAQLSSQNMIMSFELADQTGAATISSEAGTVAIEVTSGTDVTALAPTITVSAYATVSPESGAAADFTNPVTYTVTAEDGSTMDWTVTVSISTSIDLDNRAEIGLYPNPTSGSVMLTGIDKVASVRVYDLLGQMVKTIEHNGGDLEIDLSGQSSGIYMIKVSTNEQTTVLRLLKESK